MVFRGLSRSISLESGCKIRGFPDNTQIFEEENVFYNMDLTFVYRKEAGLGGEGL